MNMVYLFTYLGLLLSLSNDFNVWVLYSPCKMMWNAIFRDRVLVIDNSRHSIMLSVGQALFIRYVDINIKN